MQRRRLLYISNSQRILPPFITENCRKRDMWTFIDGFMKAITALYLEISRSVLWDGAGHKIVFCGAIAAIEVY